MATIRTDRGLTISLNTADDVRAALSSGQITQSEAETLLAEINSDPLGQQLTEQEIDAAIRNGTITDPDEARSLYAATGLSGTDTDARIRGLFGTGDGDSFDIGFRPTDPVPGTEGGG